jgi:DNA repair exonuclease SbcCD ATPase subunit
MKLLSLKFKNLFSLGEGEINLQGRGLTLVTGYSEDEHSSNGAGKSSLANKAILWTLFGETAGGLRADAVLNRHGKRKCFGEIEFEGADGEVYKIRRERPAKLSLFKGVTDISAHTAKATQSTVDRVLGFDFRTFVQTSFFGQGRGVPYPSLPPKEQKAVLEQILPMEEVDRWAVYADKQLKELRPKLNESELGIRELQGRLAALEGQKVRAETDGIEFEEGRTTRRHNAESHLVLVKKDFKPEWDLLEADRASLEGTTKDSLGIDLVSLDMRIEEVAASLSKAQETVRECNLSHSLWEAKFQSLTAGRRAINAESQCPVCKRDYDATTQTAVKEKAEQLDEQIKDSVQVLASCSEVSGHYIAEEQSLSKQRTELLRGRQDLERKLNLTGRLEQRTEIIRAKQEAAEAGARERLATVDNEKNPHGEIFKRLKGEVSQLGGALHGMHKDLATLREEVEHLAYWKDVYGKELKLKLFEDACPFLDARTEYHLGRLQNAQMHCEFSTVKRLADGSAKEEFTVHVWSETGGKGFDSLSGGEQQMVSFAVGLSLADLASRVAGASSGFLILDEPFTELDERNGEAVVEYLTSEVEGGRDTVLLISNEESLKGLIPNRIHVTKSRGISNVSSVH